jgi:DNA processing protein
MLRAAGLGSDAVAALKDPDEDAVSRALGWLQADPDNHLVTIRDAAYPSRLRQLHDAPPLLFVRGSPEPLEDPLMAIVGSRNPSPAGRDNAYDFSSYLGRCGLGIVSGLALGIDGQAHLAALESGAPTIAVCATGLDEVYPPQHNNLAEDITRAGALVSEFYPGTPPRRENFPRRNRMGSRVARFSPSPAVSTTPCPEVVTS